MPVSGPNLAYAATGGLLLFSAYKGSSITNTIQALLSGNIAEVTDTEPVNWESASNASATTGDTATGQPLNGNAIAMAALSWEGHKYVYGGPSSPNGGWDCSSFASYILGHDFGVTLPGGQKWAQATSNGTTHGPVTQDYLSWNGARTIERSQLKAGNLLCWETHIGFAADSTHMISALDTAQGTVLSGIDGYGPSGETLVCREVLGA